MGITERIAALNGTIDRLQRARAILKGVEDYRKGEISASISDIPGTEINLKADQIQDCKSVAEALVAEARVELAKV